MFASVDVSVIFFLIPSIFFHFQILELLLLCFHKMRKLQNGNIVRGSWCSAIIPATDYNVPNFAIRYSKFVAQFDISLPVSSNSSRQMAAILQEPIYAAWWRSSIRQLRRVCKFPFESRPGERISWLSCPWFYLFCFNKCLASASCCFIAHPFQLTIQ